MKEDYVMATLAHDMSQEKMQAANDRLMQEQQERMNVNAAQHISAKHEANKKNSWNNIAPEPRASSTDSAVSKIFSMKKALDGRGAKGQKTEQGT